MYQKVFKQRIRRFILNPFHFAIVGFFPILFQTSRAELSWVALSSAGFVALYVFFIEMRTGDKHRNLHLAIPAGFLACIMSYAAISGSWRLSSFYGRNDFIDFMMLLSAVLAPFIGWCLSKKDD